MSASRSVPPASQSQSSYCKCRSAFLYGSPIKERERQGETGISRQRRTDRGREGTLFVFFSFFLCRGQEKAAGDAEEWGKNFAFLFLRRPTAFRWMRTKFATAVVEVVVGGGRRGACRSANKCHHRVEGFFFVLFFAAKSHQQNKSTQLKGTLTKDINGINEADKHH